MVLATVLAVIAGILLPTAGQPAAFAGPGSLVSGLVWADTNRDGVQNAGEPVQQGVTVQLLTSPGGAVVATTTTSAAGAYSFANTADGQYIVRVTAPGAFIFPVTATGTNDFVRAGQPAPGQPERGVSAPFAIAGATQTVGLDAGMQPIANLVVEPIEMADACEGFAQTGTPPFDDTDGPGRDTGTANCVVRTEDTVLQQYAVSLTGLPGGTSVPNVVVEFTISPGNGAELELAGPGLNGIPAGCLAAANGANPASSRTLNPDGSITVQCNVGSMSSNVGILQLSYRFGADTPIPSFASVAVRAYAARGEAGTSATVVGPEVEVTGAGRWDLAKIPYPPSGVGTAGPDYTVRTYDGVQVEGYLVRYQFNITNLLAGDGGSDLVWPVEFTDVMPEFPGARITECRSGHPADSGGFSPWTLTCPIGEVQGSDGWQLTIRPNSGVGTDTVQGRMVMTVFVPIDEMNRAIDPTWQVGDPIPTGTFDFDNRAEGTDHWTINGGALNYGDGREPGWDGTGDNLAVINGTAADPQWDLSKGFQILQFAVRPVDGVDVEGFDVVYQMHIMDLAGPDNVAPWLDRPVTFKDRLVSHPDAILVECVPMATGSPLRANGLPTCETGPQPADGWDMSFEPDQTGFDRRRGDFFVRIFLPMDQIAGDICETTATLDLRNEAIDSAPWTAGGVLNNGTGFEPGWDGTTATGNNVVVNSVRPSAGECGVLSGNKQYIRNGTQITVPTFGGDIVQSFVSLGANNNRVNVDAANMALCDVFDVSVLQLVEGTPRMGTFPSGNNVNPADYVIEYAVWPNEVDTQAGPRDVNGNFPADVSSITTAATGCRGHEGPWSTDPAADFGADWLDRVNMVRVRPIDPDHVATGPFAAHLIFELRTRTFYNGGPNDAEAIPSGVRVTNIGGWPTGRTGSGWNTITRQLIFSGMRLGVAKVVTPTTYLPGATAIWDLSTWIDRATVGATLQNLRVVDTIPEGLHFDLACTQNLLPAGVTVSYDSQTRRATFVAGDIPITVAPVQPVFSPNGNPALGRLRVCTTVDTLAQPGDPYVNTVTALADNAENAPTAQATITIVGSGQLGVTKSVDKPLVASGEEYTWTVDWGNTSTEIAFQPPDVIDVLPWNGDGDPASGSARSQFESDYTGLVQLTGPLDTPTYVRGGTGVGNDVVGTWYYSTADPSTINHDARDTSNADPAAPGGLWRTAAETPDFEDVTAVRFVSEEFLPVQSRVRALIPMVSTSNGLDNVYVNRAMIYSATFPNQPLLSSEPYVLMPGFTLGDLVWIDRNGNGRFDGGEQGAPGVTVQVRNGAGLVVATATTDAAGRWSVAALPAGTYTVHIPASMFAAGGPLEDHVVRLVGSGTALPPNEGADNNNTESLEPAVTGLTSSPVTMAYEYVDGRLVGGDGPLGDDVAGLAGELIPDSFTTFTVDLALMPAPGVDIEKETNGVDADEPTGPFVPVGDEVRWTYVVTNTGGVDLVDVTVTDDLVDDADIDCDGTGSNVIPGPLAPEASFTCIATGTATAGQYANTGTVTGVDPTDVEVTDEDPSHYFGTEPSIDIEKATNGDDADVPTGPLVAVGGTVRWTYVVRNTGNVALNDVAVTDDLVDAAAIDCDGTGSNVIPGPLAPDGTFTCVATGVAEPGQYANLGTVTGVGPVTTDAAGTEVAGVEVTDEDPSHYFGAAPQVDIEKATNNDDADDAPGVQTSEGAPVTWTYVVTNTGNVPLTAVTVTDDMVGTAEIDCDGTGGNVIAGPLAPAEDFTCVATGTAIAGQYANLGTVTGTAPETTDENGDPVDGAEVTDDDPSHYFGDFAAVDIEKSTNTEDADEPTGPFVALDGAVRWTYIVVNTGTVDLYEVTVTDDMVDAAAIDCDGTGENVIAGPLAPEASITCVATGTAIAGQYANLGAVTGIAPDLPPGPDQNPVRVSDDDPSHYFGAVPAVDIEKATNGDDADSPVGPVVNVGAEVEWTYVVTNTGNVALTDVTVSDDMVGDAEIDCDGTGGNVVAGPLAPGASFTCVAAGIAVADQYANMGTVTGIGPETWDVNGETVAGAEVTDEDPSHYFGIVPSVSEPPENPATGGAPPRDGGDLPATGADIGFLPLVAGAILIAGMLLTLFTRRRRRMDRTE